MGSPEMPKRSSLDAARDVSEQVKRYWIHALMFTARGPNRLPLRSFFENCKRKTILQSFFKTQMEL